MNQTFRFFTDTWKDTIRFRVVTVNHESKTMTGEFIEKVNEPA
jgi:hypothetical protein